MALRLIFPTELHCEEETEKVREIERERETKKLERKRYRGGRHEARAHILTKALCLSA